MAFTNMRIESIGRWHVLRADMPSSDIFFLYTGYNAYAAQRQGKHRESGIAIACSSVERARELAGMSLFDAGKQVTVERSQSFPGVGEGMENVLLFHDRYGWMDDDTSLKEMYPPPLSIEVQFRWSPEEQVYRLDAVTEKAGRIVTRTVVLPQDPEECASGIEKAYERFARTSPAPIRRKGLQWGAHVAKAVKRLDIPAAAELRHWIDKIRATPLTERGNVGRLVLPGHSIDRQLAAIRFIGVRGRDEIAAEMIYRGGNSVDQQTLSVMAHLPETVLASVMGQTADVLWGAGELAEVEIRGHGQTRETKDGLVNDFRIHFGYVEVDIPEGRPADEGHAMRMLASNYAECTVDRTLARTLANLKPSWMLHLMRSLRANKGQAVDVGYIPDTDVESLVYTGDRICAEKVRSMNILELMRQK